MSSNRPGAGSQQSIMLNSLTATPVSISSISGTMGRQLQLHPVAVVPTQTAGTIAHGQPEAGENNDFLINPCTWLVVLLNSSLFKLNAWFLLITWKKRDLFL